MRQYETFELELKGSAPERSWVDIELSATFQCGDQVTTVKGFYAGNDTFKVRFLPECTGNYAWKVTSSFSLSGALTGEEECFPAMPGRHGKVCVNGVHFAYEDGTRYTPFGTTVYALAHQEETLIDQTFETLQQAPFNKLRLCLFPKSYDFNANDPELYPFQKKGDAWDVSHPCTEFWDHFETYLKKLDDLGIEADLILFHSYDRWGFSKLSKEEAFTYLDYLVRRFAAFPNIWWSLANEYELLTAFEETWWQEFAEFISANDPYHHLLSNHNILKLWDFSKPETTHCCLQDMNVIRVPDFQKKYHKPVVYDECRYEGNIMYPWGNLSGEAMTQQFWIAVTMGGYATHGDTFFDDKDVLWWAKGGTLKGESAPRIGFLRELIESLPGDLDYIPHALDEAIAYAEEHPEEKPDPNNLLQVLAKIAAEDSELRRQDLLDKERWVMGHCGDAAYLRYFRSECPAKGELWLPEDKTYTVEVIDTWEMTRTTVLRGVSGHVIFDMPGKPGMAALALVDEK